MVNFGNCFGVRAVDPFSMRQKMLKCKEQGLVFDAVEDKCRPKRTGGRKSVGPSVATLRAACKAQGLVLDMDSKTCRESRKGTGLKAARTARAMNRVLAGPTQKDMMDACKAQGLVFDRDSKQCRERKVRRGKEVDPFSMRQKLLKCKEQGLVFDAVEDKCRPKRTGGRPRADDLEAAYRRGSLYFGMTRPASDQRPGIVYTSPASTLTAPYYPIMGPVTGPVTGPASFLVAPSTLSPKLMKELGVSVPKVADKKVKFGRR